MPDKAKTPEEIPIIVLDAGHTVENAQGTYKNRGIYTEITGERIYEGDLARKFTLKLQAELEERGYQVVLTQGHHEDSKGNTFNNRFKEVQALKDAGTPPLAYMSLHYDNTPYVNPYKTSPEKLEDIRRQDRYSIYDEGRGKYPQFYYHYKSEVISEPLAHMMEEKTEGIEKKKFRRTAPIAVNPYYSRRYSGRNHALSLGQTPAVLAELESLSINPEDALDEDCMDDLINQIADGFDQFALSKGITIIQEIADQKIADVKSAEKQVALEKAFEEYKSIKLEDLAIKPINIAPNNLEKGKLELN